MLFNSYIYIFVFLPITFIIYFYLIKKRLIILSKTFLIFSSLFFYAYWNIMYLPLILISMLFNYSIGNSFSEIKKQRIKKIILVFGISINLILLGYFKYSDFFIENINNLFHVHLSLLNLALPLAISFFTFQQIAYLVDSYKGETKEYNFLNYALFVTFFPQLIAGPIVHHKEMMPQFANIWNLSKNYKNIALGIFIFSMGLFKKVVIADTFALWANNGFDIATHLNMIEAWVVSLSYTFELYFDFSGYTDMAIGSALLFNIKLPINFFSPYKSLNIQDFWRRWHITLGRFLKEYIYIPLGGNRTSKVRTYINLLITFILAGLWHGASWLFVFWGFLHGMALVIHRIWHNFNFKMNKILAWFITFNFINISWVFFRAKDWDSAIKILHGMFLGELILPEKLYVLHDFNIKLGYVFSDIQGKDKTFIFVIFAFIIVLFFKNSIEYMSSFKPTKWTLIWSVILFVYSVLSLTKVSEFIYFNF